MKYIKAKYSIKRKQGSNLVFLKKNKDSCFPFLNHLAIYLAYFLQIKLASQQSILVLSTTDFLSAYCSKNRK